MTATVTLPADEQILITREFDAPRQLIYKAYTTPELVRRWWSGRRGAMTVVEIDLRVGGGRCSGHATNHIPISVCVKPSRSRATMPGCAT